MFSEESENEEPPVMEMMEMFPEEEEKEEPPMEMMTMLPEEEKEEDQPMEMPPSMIEEESSNTDQESKPEMMEMVEEEKEEEESSMEMTEEIEDEKEEKETVKEKKPDSKTTKSSNAKKQDNPKQKENVQQEKTKTVRLEAILEKIEKDVKAIDKNLQLISLVKIKVMAGDNQMLNEYNIPFYKPKNIYLNQMDMTDNRVIYDVELVEYKQNDPITKKRQRINNILQERQNLISELEALQNG